MQETPSKSIKILLTTFEDGGNNHYSDSTFNLRIPFKPNRNGAYRVEFNEVMFKNNEETLRKDIDYYEFNIYMNNQTVYKVRYTMNSDIYNYVNKHEQLISIMKGETTYLTKTQSGAADVTITLYGESKTAAFSSKSFDTTMTMRATISGNGVTLANIEKVTMKYSSNFAYLFNNLTAEYVGSKQSNSNYDFSFINLRLGGAYVYVIDTSVNADVKTYNAVNQAYNVMAMSYNYAETHNSVIQCNSTMTGTTNDLSNFRFRVLNDQWEPVNIKQPCYAQITVSNSD